MVCWLPVSAIGRLMEYENNANSFANYLSTGLIVLNSAVNPFLYILPNTEMKNCLKSKLFLL